MFKYLMALMLAFTSQVFAADVMEAVHPTNGDRVVLTDEQAKCPPGFLLAKYFDRKNKLVRGCWTMGPQNNIQVQYEDGDMGLIHMSHFQPVKKV